MREILFRGKRVDNGEWVEGDLTSYPDGTWQISFFPFGANSHPMVIPSTVGQFTGLLDKNGTRIFEGDIVKSPRTEIKYLVEWNAIYCMFQGVKIHFRLILDNPSEVIGNIHDNPKLLEENNANAPQ